MIAKNGMSLVRFSVDRPRLVTWTMALFTLAVAGLAALPSVWPPAARALNPVRVDPGPENMFSAAEPVRVFHNAMKAEFSLYDMVVVGVVNEANPDGVFNVDSLGRIYELRQYTPPPRADNGGAAGRGAVRFDWLMPAPPTTQAEALSIRERARRIPLFDGTLVSEDGRAVALYLPLTSKD